MQANWIIGPGAVSYTHLDVYKRQLYNDKNKSHEQTAQFDGRDTFNNNKKHLKLLPNYNNLLLSINVF